MNSDKLKRNIGLVSATSIGLGAMLGAGIFVFPGLAGGEAGVLAIVSFLIGGIVALLVAACTAELATAMPNSGGGYFYISRSFGNFWGTLIGISQWVGLIFACAFYLVSFTEYALTLFQELNIQWDVGKTIISFTFTLLLLILNIIGTKKVGYFQNLMVIFLTVMLVLIFSYGVLDFFGLKNKPYAFNKIASDGAEAIFTTTALIFTSYLGFVQIANLGSEIKHPNKNLQRSLIWSVIIAMALYIFIMVVCILTFPQEELSKYGETATIEVARKLLGNWGAILVVFGGLLAALSSANASMMSASRGVFALSKDTFISTKASDINKRFGTPHIALVLVALPVAIMLMRSELEVFAEVASFLHLIIYTGICLSLLKLRRTNPIWYIPTFKVPFVKVVAVLGAVSCLAIVGFMQPTSLVIGTAVLLGGAMYYLLYVKKQNIKLNSPQPPHIDAHMIKPKVLIPVDITHEKKDVPHAILNAIPISKLLLLGFKKTPEQSESEQSEKKFGKEGEEMLDGLKQQLENVQVDFDSKLIFSNAIKAQVKQLIDEEELQFILMLKPLSEINQLVIPIYHVSQINKQLSTVIYNLYSNRLTKIKVLLFVEGETSTNQDTLGQAMKNQLKSVGITTIDFEVKTMEKASLKNIVHKMSEKPDLILWSEAKPSQPNFFLDIILDTNSDENVSPNIIILNKD